MTGIATGGRRRAAKAAALALAAGLLGGCSLLPFRPASGPAEKPAAPEETPTVAADSTATAPSGSVEKAGTADSVTVAEGAPGKDMGDTVAVVPGQVPSPSPPTSPPTTPAPAPAAEKTPPPAPDPEADDQVKVQISDAERAELETQARESLREARRVIRSIDRSTLSAERLEKLATAESLVESARAAFDTDIRAAATLAHKASVLLAELTSD